MAFSNSISNTTFNAIKVVDHAFRRCRLPAQAITAEMQSYALDCLYLLLSNLANIKPPSWCIQKIILPMYENQPNIDLPLGTVEILNANYRTLQILGGATSYDSTTYTVYFSTQTIVSTVGVLWSGASTPLTFQVSDDGIIWVDVGSANVSSTALQKDWFDIDGAKAYKYFRISSTGTFNHAEITLGNMPSEIPFGVLNRDTYVDQPNKIFPGRPTCYWFQRDIPQPVMHIWPAPNQLATQSQLVIWRHRHIMDTQNLRQTVDVPQRWLEAVTAMLASKIADETPSVDINIIPLLEQKALNARKLALDGDNDGSPIFIQPNISAYTA
jgi:hypothetical protein